MCREHWNQRQTSKSVSAVKTVWIAKVHMMIGLLLHLGPCQDVTGNAPVELKFRRNEGWWTGNEDWNGPTTPRGKEGTGRECQKTTVHRWWMELSLSIGVGASYSPCSRYYKKKKKHFLIKPHPTNTRRKLPNPSPLNKNCNFVSKKVQIKNEISNSKCRVYYAIIKKLFDVCIKLYLKRKRYNNGVDTFVAR